MQLVIVSGRSGSGKSTALQVLEDSGFYCVDNLPVGLLNDLVTRLNEPLDEQSAALENNSRIQRVAVGIDARNVRRDLKRVPEIIEEIQKVVDLKVIYLDAQDEVLLKRFSATRRKHPLSNADVSLSDALQSEQELLTPIAHFSSLSINTSELTIYQLRERVRKHICEDASNELQLLIQSFGFKHGVPPDTDFVFDVRCLPNPHWNKDLRPLTGLNDEVKEFMFGHKVALDMLEDVYQFIDKWLSTFASNDRTYLTISIGCTGGQHRSVFIVDELKKRFSNRALQIKHRELETS